MTEKYVLTFAKDDKGQDIKYRFILSSGKKLSDVKEFFPTLMAIPGFDRIEPIGFYSVDLAICRAFDADEVLAELEKQLNIILSNITLVTK